MDSGLFCPASLSRQNFPSSSSSLFYYQSMLTRYMLRPSLNGGVPCGKGYGMTFVQACTDTSSGYSLGDHS